MIGVGVGLAICLAAAYFVFHVLRFMIIWIGAYVPLGLIVGGLLLVLYGMIGQDFGLPSLFRPEVEFLAHHDDVGTIFDHLRHRLWTLFPRQGSEQQTPFWSSEERTQFCSAVGVISLFYLISLLVHILDRGRFSNLADFASKNARMSLRPYRTPVVPGDAEGIRRMVSRLVFRPCLILGLLASGAGFVNVRTRGSLAENLHRVAWWWLLGLAVAVLAAWLLSGIAAWLLGQTAWIGDRFHHDFVVKSRPPMLVLTGWALSIYAGFVMGFSRAGDLEILDVANSSLDSRRVWYSLLAAFLLIGFTLGSLLWTSDVLRKRPGSSWAHTIKNILISMVMSGLGYLLMLSVYMAVDTRNPLLVSLVICMLLGLVTVVYAGFQTIPPVRRLLLTLAIVLILFVANGTDLLARRNRSPAEDYKLKFSGMEFTGNDGKQLSYYDYPVPLESRSYLERSYLRANTITKIEPLSDIDTTIIVTSGWAHDLRSGDSVRIRGVRGCASANGSFIVRVDDELRPNRFELVGSSASGNYTSGGDWLKELDKGLISAAELDPDSHVRLTSLDHALGDDEEIRLTDGNGRAFGARAWKVETLKNDARSSLQFRIGAVDPADQKQLSPDRVRLLENGRWRLEPNRERTAVRKQGGVDWVTREPATLTGPAPAIVITSRNHGIRGGEHVSIEGVVANPDANGIFTADFLDEDHFNLVEPGRGVPIVDPDEPRSPAVTSADYMSGGSWLVVTDSGRVLDATNQPNQPILIRSRNHGLVYGDHVEITDVRGNTRANGIWTVRPSVSKEEDNSEHDHFELVSSRASGEPEFVYAGGGEWRRVPHRGRIELLEVSPGEPRLLVRSTRHGLTEGTVVAVSGTTDEFLPSSEASSILPRILTGLFRVKPLDPDRFGLFDVPIGAIRDMPAGRVPSSSALQRYSTWRIILGQGTILGVTRESPAVHSDLIVRSPNHRLRLGDHVRIVGGAWPPGTGVYAIKPVSTNEDPLGNDHFALIGTGELGDPRFDPQRELGGRWERVLDAGIVEDCRSVNGGKSIEVTSPGHGLKSGERVQVQGPRWSEDLGMVFTVSVDTAAGGAQNRFLLNGTEGITPEGPGVGTGSLNHWRRVDVLDANGLVLASKARRDRNDPTGFLIVDSIRHGLNSGDRIRVERIVAHEGHLEPGQRFDDTAPVERVSADSFKIPIPASWSYPVHPGGLSSLQLIDATGSERGTTRLLLAWRPVFNRGVVERVERVPSSDDDPRSLGRLRVYSRSNGLSPGARIWLTGIPGLDRDTHRVDNVATGLAGRRGYFEILVPKTHIENSLHKNPLQEIGGKLPEDREDYPPQNMKRWGVVGLFDDQELLGNWSDACQERWLNRRRETAREGSAPVIPPRPKLAIVTVSGGGIRSAFWTAVVLRELERRVPDFPWQLRLVTGASGGMLGAAHYVSSLQRPSDTSEQEPIHVLTDGTPISTDELIEHMAGDHLSRVANQLAFADLASMLIPFAWGRDRGQALETTWWRNTGGIGRSPLESPLRGLAVGEWEGWRPSLVFTPMLVEDGRRILISNLNLDYAPRNVGQILFARGTDKLSRNVKQSASYLKPGWDIYSLSAVEFYRVFPDAHEFRVSTAARMSAAFPLVTPAVSLPTIPPRRVVDAGYYDNYGVNLAATWVFQNRASLLDSTSGVVLIQIRDSQTERLRRELEDPEPVESNNLLARLFRTTPSSSRALDMFNDVAAKMHRGSQWLTSPLEGLSAARQSNMSFRNDEQMEILHNVFNIWRDSPVRGRGFCTTVVFECPREASLSWTITPREREDIRRGFDPDRIDPSYSDNARKNLERLNSLLEWWNR